MYTICSNKNKLDMEFSIFKKEPNKKEYNNYYGNIDFIKPISNYYVRGFLKSTSGTYKWTDFQVYLVTLIYRLNCSYRSLSFHGNVLLEQ